MTTSEDARFKALWDKLEAAAERADRKYTNTSDLTAAERSELHRLQLKMEGEGEETHEPAQTLADVMPKEDEPSDAAW